LEVIGSADINKLYAQAFGIVNALKTSQLEYVECAECGLKFFWPMETGDESLYERLQALDWYYMADKEEYQIALRHLPVDGTILEVGAGKAAFATLVGAGRYTGLEFNDRAIKQAEMSGIALLKESVEVHATKSNQYDSVVSFQVLEHVSLPFEFVKGCVDCLKAGGVLILAVPSQDGFAGKAVNHLLDMPPHHVSHWSEKTMRKLADLFGLDVLFVEHEPVSSYHRQWVDKIRIETAIRKILGVDFRLLDRSFSARLIAKIAHLISRFSRQSQAGLKGHTMVAGYRKRGSV
jgi:2-polyprenyl-3-methyl-5-hydroxy-6-metoxy-1,4-benzoquinol methylase